LPEFLSVSFCGESSFLLPLVVWCGVEAFSVVRRVPAGRAVFCAPRTPRPFPCLILSLVSIFRRLERVSWATHRSYSPVVVECLLTQRYPGLRMRGSQAHPPAHKYRFAVLVHTVVCASRANAGQTYSSLLQGDFEDLRQFAQHCMQVRMISP
jgi:hypothetical protein